MEKFNYTNFQYLRANGAFIGLPVLKTSREAHPISLPAPFFNEGNIFDLHEAQPILIFDVIGRPQELFPLNYMQPKINFAALVHL